VINSRPALQQALFLSTSKPSFQWRVEWQLHRSAPVFIRVPKETELVLEALQGVHDGSIYGACRHNPLLLPEPNLYTNTAGRYTKGQG